VRVRALLLVAGLEPPSRALSLLVLGRGKERVLEELANLIQDFFHVPHDLLVAEADHPETTPGKKGAAPPVIALRVFVLNPVDLNDEPTLDAAEVSEVGPDRMLASKLGAI
jgi:hypothetical protein